MTDVLQLREPLFDETVSTLVGKLIFSTREFEYSLVQVFRTLYLVCILKTRTIIHMSKQIRKQDATAS